MPKRVSPIETIRAEIDTVFDSGRPIEECLEDLMRHSVRLVLQQVLEHSSGAVGVVVDLVGRHGLRPAEARAMTWANIDLGRGTLRVTAQIGATNTFAPPKTTRPTRTIRLHPGASARLQAWRPQQANERSAARQA